MWSQYGVPVGPKSKPKIFDSAVALFTERLFYSESLLVSALIKITFLLENPSRPGRRELPITCACTSRAEKSPDRGTILSVIWKLKWWGGAKGGPVVLTNKTLRESAGKFRDLGV